MLADATVRCWGHDAEGQLGDGGPTMSPNAAPVGVVGLPALASPDTAALALVATAAVGGQVVITLTLSNSGVDATTATVAAPLGAGLTPATATAAQGSYSTATGLWKAGTIPSGATATLTLAAKVSSPGTLTTTAEVVDASAQDPDSTPANDAADEDNRATSTVVATSPATITSSAPPVVTPTKVRPDLLTIRLTPKRDSKPPFRFTATARLIITKAPLATACNGIVRFTARTPTKKAVLTQRAPLRLKHGICTATTKTTIRKHPGKARTLTYTAVFPGNSVLTTVKSKSGTARIT